ncbi:DUF2388 domain-containing protein [Morganella morganii subsp. sibonii]
MKRLRLIGAAALLACASSAFASSFVVTTDTLVRATGMTSNATSAQESSADEGDKLVQARDDAASFVASDGAIRGAYLQAALQVLRQAPEYAGYSDLQLAAALLARQP